MPTTPGSVKVAPIDSLLAAILCTSAIWVLRGYIWPHLSNVEVDVLRAILDPSLFKNDFSVQASQGFTPRYYFNAIITIPAKAGLSLAAVFALWQVVAIAALFTSIRALGKTLGLGEVATAILIVWLLTISVGTVGGVFFYLHAPVPAVWAGALVAWGAVYAWRGRWTAAFAFFGVAAMLQILVGLYAGILAVPALIGTRRPKNLLSLVPWLLGLALVYVPMRLSGGTGTAIMDNATFVAIYATLRHPHHLVPSTWGWSIWIEAVAFYAGAWWFLRRSSATRNASDSMFLPVAFGLAAGALCLNYFLVEVYPLAFVAKLQTARITPLLQCFVLVLLATRVQAQVARRDWLSVTLLCLIPFSAMPGFLLFLAAILLPTAATTSPAPLTKIALAVAVALAFQPFHPTFAVRSINYALWAALFGILLLPSWLGYRRWWLASLATVAMAVVTVCVLGPRRPEWPQFLSGQFNLNNQPGNPPGILGLRFGASAAKDAIVLVPPTNDAWNFKLYSSRAVVVEDKSSPFTDGGLKEWYVRMEQILGRKPTPDLNVAAAWRSQSPETLQAVAERYDARYVLTRERWHPILPGRKIDEESGWTLWELPEPKKPYTPPEK